MVAKIGHVFRTRCLVGPQRCSIQPFRWTLFWPGASVCSHRRKYMGRLAEGVERPGRGRSRTRQISRWLERGAKAQKLSCVLADPCTRQSRSGVAESPPNKEYFWYTTLRSIMNAKLSKQRFWHCRENGHNDSNNTPQPIGECQVIFSLLRIRINQDKP